MIGRYIERTRVVGVIVIKSHRWCLHVPLHQLEISQLNLAGRYILINFRMARHISLWEFNALLGHFNVFFLNMKILA